MLLITKTFETVTPESAEIGDFEECGFIFEDVEMSFSDLISELQSEGYCHLSNSGDITDTTWITTEAIQDRDYFEKGHETSYSLHLSVNNKPSAEKYWKWALESVAI
jgi:hypothetical protein